MLKLYIAVIEWFFKHCCTLSNYWCSIVLAPQSVVLRLATSVSPWNLLETQNLRSHPTPTESESWFSTRFSGNLTVASCLRNEEHWARGHNKKQRNTKQNKNPVLLVSSLWPTPLKIVVALKPSRTLWGHSCVQKPFCVPHFWFAGKRLQPPRPSLNSKGQIQAVTN